MDRFDILNIDTFYVIITVVCKRQYAERQTFQSYNFTICSAE
jgi:hypothetical protein